MKQDLRKRGFFCAIRRSILCGFVSILFSDMAYELFHEHGLSHLIIPLIVVLISVAVAATNIVWAIRGGPLRGIERFCRQADDSNAMMARLEQVWDEGFFTRRRNFCADHEYLIGIRNMRSFVVPIKDILWVKNQYDPFTWSTRSISIITSCGKDEGITPKFKDAYDIEEYIGKNFPDIIVGRNKKMRELLRENDFEGMNAYARRWRRRQRKAKTENITNQV